MKLINKFEIDLPEYAVGYLEYGKDSSENLSDKDIQIIDKWYTNLKEEYNNYQIILNYSDMDPYFCRNPEFGLACSCITCVITICTN